MGQTLVQHGRGSLHPNRSITHVPRSYTRIDGLKRCAHHSHDLSVLMRVWCYRFLCLFSPFYTLVKF
ncbi:hypothetical protein HanIR_Chr14g0705041 [Helianthus annuus]|nr:hypothetical protein HanIR_Chr14g0705041 [Helianthus annuus]